MTPRLLSFRLNIIKKNSREFKIKKRKSYFFAFQACKCGLESGCSKNAEDILY
jgi:hypothetical protein